MNFNKVLLTLCAYTLFSNVSYGMKQCKYNLAPRPASAPATLYLRPDTPPVPPNSTNESGQSSFDYFDDMPLQPIEESTYKRPEAVPILNMQYAFVLNKQRDIIKQWGFMAHSLPIAVPIQARFQTLNKNLSEALCLWYRYTTRQRTEVDETAEERKTENEVLSIMTFTARGHLIALEKYVNAIFE